MACRVILAYMRAPRRPRTSSTTARVRDPAAVRASAHRRKSAPVNDSPAVAPQLAAAVTLSSAGPYLTAGHPSPLSQGGIR